MHKANKTLAKYWFWALLASGVVGGAMGYAAFHSVLGVITVSFVSFVTTTFSLLMDFAKDICSRDQ